jgi:hypothetical protein
MGEQQVTTNISKLISWYKAGLISKYTFVDKLIDAMDEADCKDSVEAITNGRVVIF